MSDPAPRVAATTSYGRACNNCAKAKCKCIFVSNPKGPCERCLRLRKDCHPAPGVRKKPGRKPVSKTAQLQDKLDDLVTLLRSAAATNGTSADALLHQARSLSQMSASNHENEPEQGVEPACHPSSSSSSLPPALSKPDNHSPNNLPSPVSIGVPSQPDHDRDYGVSPMEAEKCLHMFRTQRLKYLHFVYLPETTTAAQLRQEQPVLWLSIMLSCTKVVSRQQALGEKFRALVAQKVVVEHQRSLDILQGLIGFLGWSTYHLRLVGKPFMTVYCHLMASLVQDLYVDKPMPKPSDATPHPMACMRTHGFIAKALPSPVRTVQECRAVLASWLVAAAIGTFLRRNFAMPWTAHMDDCLRMLDEQPDSPLDGVLTQQVRLQRVSEEAPHQSVHLTAMEVPLQARSVWEFQIRALQLKLEEVKKTEPKNLPQDAAFVPKLHAISTELELLEPALYTSAPPRPSSPPISSSSSPNISRITTLTTILHLTKEWFDILFKQPPAQFLMFSLPLATQMSYLAIIMYRLSTLDDPYWDKALVRQTLDTFSILDQLAARFAGVPAECGIICDKPELDTWEACNRAIRHMRTSWESVFARLIQIQLQGGGAGTGRYGAGGVDGTGLGNCGDGTPGGAGVNGGVGLGADGSSQVQGQPPQMTGAGIGSVAMDTGGGPGAATIYDGVWNNYAFDVGDMTTGWIADMFAASWDTA